MKDIIEDTPLWWKLLLIFNALLILTSFLLPPTGVVHNSVLTAVGELGGFALLGMIPHYLKVGKSVKVSKGDTTIELESKNNN